MRDDGRPAFPTPDFCDEKQVGVFYGMSLRDWFAGQALASLSKLLPDVWNEHDVGKISYVIADALLKERNK